MRVAVFTTLGTKLAVIVEPVAPIMFSESQRQILTGVLGMIEVAKGVEVLADRVRELEAEAKGIEVGMKDKTKTLERIDDLLGRTKHHTSEIPRSTFEPRLVDASDQSDDFILGLNDSGRKSAVPRKSTGRN